MYIIYRIHIFTGLSADNSPHLYLCQAGPDTRCPFRKAEDIGTIYDHKHSIPDAVMDITKPI